jgi:hypothetical protein
MKSAAIALCLVMMWPFGGGKKFHMLADKSIPAAAGTVEARRDKNDANTHIEVKVENMADPSRLSPPASVYVVWVRPRTGNIEKEGLLTVGKDLKGDLKTTTTSRDFEVVVTAEQSGTVEMPSGPELMKANIVM